MFAKEIYIARRAALLEKMKGEKGVIVFIGNAESPAQYRENGYKFRQDSTFLYFFGIDAPKWAATIDIESGEQTLFADDADIDDIIWNGPEPSVAETAATVGICKTAPYGALKAAVKGRKIHFVPASREYNALKLSELTGLKAGEHFCTSKAGCAAASQALVRAIVSQRLVKSAEEIAALDRACILGEEMHTVARKAIKLGIREQEIVGKMEGLALAKGWGVSFPTILTQHGEVFHCHSHENLIEPGRLMVIDAGLESNEYYASDFTRTYPTGGKYTPRQREIYQTVYDCHEYAFAHTKPGVEYRDVHLGVEKVMLEHLAVLGIVSGDPAELAADGLCGIFLPHGLGHNMGLDVHDMEDYGENLVGYDDGQSRSPRLGLGSLRMARKLVPGNVITDEPGIYFIPALIKKWKEEGIGKGAINYAKLENEYLDFGGIRIEDDVLVTEDGARRLGGTRLPASPDEVEEAMKND